METVQKSIRETESRHMADIRFKENEDIRLKNIDLVQQWTSKQQ